MRAAMVANCRTRSRRRAACRRWRFEVLRRARKTDSAVLARRVADILMKAKLPAQPRSYCRYHRAAPIVTISAVVGGLLSRSMISAAVGTSLLGEVKDVRCQGTISLKFTDGGPERMPGRRTGFYAGRNAGGHHHSSLIMG